MKIFVDELPKSCEECPFCEYFEKDAHGKGKHEVACYFNGSLGNILYGNQTSPKTCPLKSLADHDKQVRKEVVQEINAELYNKMVLYNKKLEYSEIALILNQIQGENNG